MKNALTEFIGTYFLVLIIGMVVTAGLPMAPIAIGVGLIALVYMGGPISGAHYNPAVTLGMVMRGRMSGRAAVRYVVVQVLGGLAAAATVQLVTGLTFAPAPAEASGWATPLFIETLFTFLLVLVILNVATTPGLEGNDYYGLAIGCTVMAGVFAGGHISGGAFNPAVGLGPIAVHALIGPGGFGDLGLYLVGPFAGAALAAVVCRLLHDRQTA